MSRDILLLEVMEDIEEYLLHLTLVGGWLPHVYAHYLWKLHVPKPVTTTDIDFALGEPEPAIYSETIHARMSSLGYKERHTRIGRLQPVVMYKEGKTPVEFLSFSGISREKLFNIIGRQIHINFVEHIEFLMKNRIPIPISLHNRRKKLVVFCPKPSAFAYHKAGTLSDRDDDLKKARDLFYVYFILRYAPDPSTISKEICRYNAEGIFPGLKETLNRYFSRVTGPGCLWVEKENGPDDFLDDVRQDIFRRFQNFMDWISGTKDI